MIDVDFCTGKPWVNKVLARNCEAGLGDTKQQLSEVKRRLFQRQLGSPSAGTRDVFGKFPVKGDIIAMWALPVGSASAVTAWQDRSKHVGSEASASVKCSEVAVLSCTQACQKKPCDMWSVVHP